jgi:RimJ/RimL family protein N-acetyltransferase
MRPEIRIATQRLLLRPPESRDVDDIVAGVNDMAVAGKLSRVPYPYGRADAEAFLAQIAPSIAAGSEATLMVLRDGRAIGCIGVSDIPGTCEFGYWLGRDHWGRGYATEAGRALLGYCFGVIRLPLLRSGVFVDNPASMRVQRKLGFRRIGVSQRHGLARGRPVPHIDTVLTRRRFLGARVA